MYGLFSRFSRIIKERKRGFICCVLLFSIILLATAVTLICGSLSFASASAEDEGVSTYANSYYPYIGDKLEYQTPITLYTSDFNLVDNKVDDLNTSGKNKLIYGGEVPTSIEFTKFPFIINTIGTNGSGSTSIGLTQNFLDKADASGQFWGVKTVNPTWFDSAPGLAGLKKCQNLAWLEALGRGSTTKVYNSNTGVLYSGAGAYSTTIEYVPPKIGAFGKVEIPTLYKTATSAEITTLVNLGKAFKDKTELKEIKLGTWQKEIGDYDFQNCTSLVRVEGHAAITRIGAYAFEFCSSLSTYNRYVTGTTSLIFPLYGFTGLKSIGNYAFKNTGIVDLKINNNGTTYGLNILSNITEFGHKVFWGCPQLKSADMSSASLITELSYTFGYSRSLEEVKLPPKLVTIGNSVFAATKIEHITIPATVTSIGTSVFESAANLKTITYEGVGLPATADNLNRLLNCTGESKTAILILGGYNQFIKYSQFVGITTDLISRLAYERAVVFASASKSGTTADVEGTPVLFEPQTRTVQLLANQDFRYSKNDDDNWELGSSFVPPSFNVGTVVKWEYFNGSTISTSDFDTTVVPTNNTVLKFTAQEIALPQAEIPSKITYGQRYEIGIDFDPEFTYVWIKGGSFSSRSEVYYYGAGSEATMFDDAYEYIDYDLPTEVGKYEIHLCLQLDVGLKIQGDGIASGPSQLLGEFEIEKADIDMTNYTMSPKTVTYNGSAHSITMSGTRPAGITNVTYTYKNSSGTAVTAANVKNADTYTVTATFVYDTTNYNAPNPTSRSATLTIERATISMSGYTLSNKSVVYNGSSQSGALIMSGTRPTGITNVTYTYKNSSGSTVTAANVKNADTYTVTATFTVNSNYKPVAAKSATLTITKATYNMSGVTMTPKTVTYNGTAQSITYSGTLPTGVTLKNYTYNNVAGTSATNAGTYTVACVFNYDTTNYYAPDAKSATLTINKAGINVTNYTLSNKTVTYNGSSQSGALVISGTRPAGITNVTYTYKNSSGSTVTAANVKNADTYTVTATFVYDTANYSAPNPTSRSATLKIDKADIVMTNYTMSNKTVIYNGTAQSITMSGTRPTGITAVSYTYNNVAGTSKTNAGTYTVRAVFTYDTVNYNAPDERSATLEIKKATISMSGYTLSNKSVFYNGSSQSGALVMSGTQPTGITGVTYSYKNSSGTAVTAANVKNVGTYTVTATFTVDSNHEAVTAKSATLTINKATYNMSGVTMSNKTVTYNGTAQSITYSGTLPTGVTLKNYTYNNVAGTSATNAGTYTVACVFNYDTTNYYAPEAKSATLKIERADIVMTNYTMSPKTVTYNGTAQSITMSGTMPKGITAVSYTYNGTAGTGKTNAGTYTVAAVFTYDTVNYNAPESRSATLEIRKATYNMNGVTMTGKTVSYDGTKHSIELDGTLPAGVTLKHYTYNGTQSDGATAVGKYTVTAVFDYDTVNYNPPATRNAILNITAASIDMSGVVFGDATYTYTPGVERSIVASNLPDTILSVSYTYTIKGGTAQSVSGVINAGTYTVTAKFTVKDGANYSTPADMTATLRIDKATIDMSGVEFKEVTVTYDGTSKADSIGIIGDLPDNVSVTYIYKFRDAEVAAEDVISAGPYEVIARFTIKSDAANYNKIPDMTASLIIIKGNIDLGDITFVSTTVLYNGKAQGLKLTGSALPDGYTVTYVYRKDGVIIDASQVIEVGVYTVNAVFGGYNTDDYYIPDLIATLTINPADINLDAIIFANAEYTYEPGVERSIVATNIPDSILSVEYTYTLDGGSAQSVRGVTNAGTYTVTAKFTVRDNKNYNTPDSKTAILTIKKATVDTTGYTLKGGSATYDGTSKSGVITMSGTMPAGITGVTYSYAQAGTPVNAENVINAGDYTVIATFTVDSNYEPVTEMTATLTIDRATIIMTGYKLNSKTVIYNGLSQSDALTMSGEMPEGITGVTLTFSQQSFPVAAKDVVNVGKYTVTATFTVDANYNSVSNQTAILTIDPAALNMDGVTMEDLRVTYDGSTFKIELSGALPAGIKVDYYTYNGERADGVTDAGEYTVVAVFAYDSDNYEAPEEFSATLTIDKGTVVMDGYVLNDTRVSYTGSSQSGALVMSGTRPAGITDVIYTYIKDGKEIPSEKVINVGEYTVKATFTVNKNYNAVSALEAVLSIDKAVYEMDGVTMTDFVVTYDGNLHSITYSGTLPEGVTLDHYTYNGEEAEGAINADTYTVVAVFGYDTENYEAPASKSAVLTIERAVIDMDGYTLDNANKKYTGSSQTLTMTGTMPDGITGITITYEQYGAAIAAEDVIGVGTYTVTVTFTVDSNHYEVTSQTAILVIIPADVDMTDVNFADKTVTYNKGSFSLEATNLPANVEVTYVYTLNGVEIAPENVINAGEYTVTARFVYNAADKENYNPIADKTATLTIDKATVEIDITFEDAEYVYAPGTERAIEFSGTLPEGVSYKYVYTKNGTAVTSVINAGTYTVTLSFTYTDTENYAPIADKTATLTIKRAVIDMTGVEFEGAEFVYEPDTERTISATNLPEGVTGIYTYEKDGTVNSCATTVGIYQVTVTFTYVDSENYEIPDTLTVTLEIKKAVVDMSGVVFEDTVFVYDADVERTLEATNLPKGVTVTYVYEKDGEVVTSAVSVGKYTVTASFTYIDANNYELIPDMQAVITIDLAEFDMTGVEFEDKEFIYNKGSFSIEATNLPADVQVTYVYKLNGEEIAQSNVINAGEYTVTADFTYVGVDKDNFKDLQPKTVKLTINKANVDMTGVTFENKEVTYNKNSFSIEATNLPAEVEVSYVYKLNGVEVAPETVIDAGEYTVTAKFVFTAEDKENYNDIADVTVNLLIKRATLSTDGLKFPDTKVVFNGESKTIKVQGTLPEGITEVTYVYTKDSTAYYAAINAGTYKVTAMFAVSANYEPVPSMEAQLVIEKAEVKTDGIKFDGKEVDYDGTVHTMTVSGVMPAALTIEYAYKKNGVAVDAEDLKNAGEYEVTARLIFDEENYNTAGDIYLTAKLTINKIQLNTDSLYFEDDDVKVVYDGNVHGMVLKGTAPVGVEIVYAYTKEGAGSVTADDLKNAGKYTVTASFVYDEENYITTTVSDIVAHLTIDKYTLNPETLDFGDKTVTYNREAQGITVSGDMPAFGVTITYTYYKNGAAVAATEVVNAGEYEIVAEFSVDEENFNALGVKRRTAKLTIQKADVDLSGVTFADVNVKYDEKVHELTVTGNLPEGLTVTYTYYKDGVEVAPENVTEYGEYKVVAHFDYADKENYNLIPDMTATLVIHKAFTGALAVIMDNLSAVIIGVVSVISIFVIFLCLPRIVEGVKERAALIRQTRAAREAAINQARNARIAARRRRLALNMPPDETGFNDYYEFASRRTVTAPAPKPKAEINPMSYNLKGLADSDDDGFNDIYNLGK